MAIKRQLIEPHKGDKRYVRRDKKGHFTEKQVDVGLSLAADRRSNAKTKVKPGQGDKGDVKRPTKKAATKTASAKKASSKKSSSKKTSKR